MSTHDTAMGDRKRTIINWHEVRQRIEQTRAAVERVWTPDAETTRQVLKTRAVELARDPAKTQSADSHQEVLEFFLAHEKYGVGLHHVREVCNLEQLTPLPCTPSFVLGIINLRGEIVSIIELKRFFDLPVKGLPDLNKVIVLQSGRMFFGILADSLAGVRRIEVAEILQAPNEHPGIREKYLKGVTANGTILLDAERLMTDEQIIVQEQV